MNEYNERLLKNVLQDYREEIDAVLLQEIEEAKNDPRYQVKEGAAEAFAKKHVRKSGKKTWKKVLKVASIFIVGALVVSIAIPITVEGRKSSIVEIVINYVNTEFLAIGSSEDDSLLLTYEGEYIPSFIPEGYKVDSVNNGLDTQIIIFKNRNGNMLIYKESIGDIKTSIDYTDAENIEHIEILGYNSIVYERDGVKHIYIAADSKYMYITCNDSSVDLIGIANKIEKR